METHDIDKLFGERLKNAAPTPPADLWNRLQDRMETEMPVQQQEKKPVMLWRKSYYGMAAAVTVLLTATMVFFHLRYNLPAADIKIAHTEVAATKAAPAVKTPAPATETIAAKQPEATEAAEIRLKNTAAPATIAAAPAKTGTHATPKATDTKQVQHEGQQPVKQAAPMQTLALSIPTVEPTTPTDVAAVAAQPVTPIALAASQPDLNAQPVEIIIKRSPSPEVASAPAAEAEEELSGFEKKQRLAKGIFRQARNLTSGEPVDLSDLGINASRIELETQIGKQKFSKVINL
ncbi:hypothetical protein [Botryobacter ruber]|uniref:hypothetical protein n=1 Tax=Botryobacter ruber TaxID=2171629 RepID=UPI000E0A0E84|nr:hypothetical protein [Botryobacter ruber]